MWTPAHQRVGCAGARFPAGLVRMNSALGVGFRRRPARRLGYELCTQPQIPHALRHHGMSLYVRTGRQRSRSSWTESRYSQPLRFPFHERRKCAAHPVGWNGPKGTRRSLGGRIEGVLLLSSYSGGSSPGNPRRGEPPLGPAVRRPSASVGASHGLYPTRSRIPAPPTRPGPAENLSTWDRTRLVARMPRAPSL